MSIINKLLPTLNSPSIRSSFSAFPSGHAIPKIIHQTFYQPDLPEALQKNVNRLKQINPEWEYRFYDDTAIVDFITANYPPHVLKCFERLDSRYGAAKADLFRYLLLYKHGGVYLDIKSSATRPLDSVLKPDDVYLLSYWQNRPGELYEGWGLHDELKHMQNGEFQQWYIAAAPGHPFLKAVIETVLQNIKSYNPALHGVGKHGVLRVTGPVPYSLSISRCLGNYKYRLVNSIEDLGFSYSVYEKQAHVGIFKTHYTALAAPVVKMSWAGLHISRFILKTQSFRRVLIKNLNRRKSIGNSAIEQD